MQIFHKVQKVLGPAFWVMGAIGIFAIAVSMGGCASPTGKGITPPPEYLMQGPRRFPKVKGGDDAKVRLAEAAEVHNRNARKIRGLQDYIKASRQE